MNEDGSLGIPHGSQSEEEAPKATPIISSAAEGTAIAPAADSADNHILTATHDTAESTFTASEPINTFSQTNNNAISTNTPNDSTAVNQPVASSTHIANNPFGGRSRYQAPSSNANQNSNIPQFFNEAIAINTEAAQPKRSGKKRFVIGGIIALVLIGATIVAATLIPKLVQDNKKQQTISNIKTPFLRFANIVLSNSDIENDIPSSYDETAIYEIVKYYRNDEKDEQYTNSLYTAFMSFIDAYKAELPNIENEKFIEAIESYSSCFSTYYRNHTINDLTLDDVYNTYLASGESATIDYINNHYSNYTDLLNNKTLPTQKEKIAYYTAYVEILKEYASNSCDIKSNNQCVELLANSSEKVKDNYAAMASSQESSETIIDLTKQYVYSGLWNINKSFNEYNNQETKK